MTKRGNALFLILIAVALFGALAYAVTQSGRGGSGGVSRETASIHAARIMEWSALAQQAALRLTLTSNVTMENIHFENDAYKKLDGTAGNGTLGSPADPTLYLFHPQGGGVPQTVFTEASTTCAACDTAAFNPGHTGIRWTRLDGLGSDTGDLVLMVSYLTQSVCSAINTKADVPGIPSVNLAIQVPTYGVAPPTGLAAPAGAGTADIAGKMSFCIYRIDGANNSGYVYFNVMQVN